MTIIYRKDDLIKLKIGDLTFSIRPMSYQDRVSVLSALSNEGGSVIENAALATFKTMKHTIVSVDGAMLLSGDKYKITKDDDGKISDTSIDELLNLEENNLLGLALNNFLRGVPAKIINPNTGEELEGVEIVKSKGVPKK